jgi:hypothetical protein
MAMLRLFKAIKPMSTFHTDISSPSSGHAAEMFASVRENGRIVDQVRYVFGGDSDIEAIIPVASLCGIEEFAGYTIKLQRAPDDIELRRGLLTGNWIDIIGLVSSRDATVFDDTGAGVAAAEFLRRVRDAEATIGAVRWGLVLDDSARLALQLQGLPASAAVLNGKPALKRYHLFYFYCNKIQPKAFDFVNFTKNIFVCFSLHSWLFRQKRIFTLFYLGLCF